MVPKVIQRKFDESTFLWEGPHKVPDYEENFLNETYNWIVSVLFVDHVMNFCFVPCQLKQSKIPQKN
jgi:hypothetical protein